MLKSRAELAELPRTAQFLVERECPFTTVPHPISRWLPIAVEVDLSGTTLHHCGGKAWKLASDVARKEDGGTVTLRPVNPGAQMAACEHMGRLIE